MIISFNRYNGGGGSGSGVTPQYVQRQIDSALTYYWESGETKDYVDGAVSGISLDGYYTSAQTEDAISAATSGKADKVEVTPNTDTYDGHFPLWNADGVITGEGDKAWRAYLGLNSESYLNFWSQDGNSYSIYAPTTSGNSGEILVSTGSGAPVWSAVTMGGDSSDIELPIAAAVNNLKTNVEARLNQNYFKKQEVLDMLKEKVTAGEVSQQIVDAITPLFEAVYAEIEDKELAVSAAINDLNTKINNN